MGSLAEVLVKAVEREALVTLERLANVMDAQGLQVRTSSTITIGPRCVGTWVWVLPSVECRAILFHVSYENLIITIR